MSNDLINENEDEYITAGELRKMGIPIPDKIPDCAIIPKSSINIAVDPNIKTRIAKDGTLIQPIVFKTAVAFTWNEVTVTAVKKDDV